MKVQFNDDAVRVVDEQLPDAEIPNVVFLVVDSRELKLLAHFIKTLCLDRQVIDGAAAAGDLAIRAERGIAGHQVKHGLPHLQPGARKIKIRPVHFFHAQHFRVELFAGCQVPGSQCNMVQVS